MNSPETAAKLQITAKSRAGMALLLLLVIAFIANGAPLGYAQTRAASKSNQSTAFPRQGIALASHGQLARAQLVLEHARRLAPQNVAILTVLGKVKARIGENAAATELFRRVVALRPASASAHIDLAIALAD